MFREGSLPDVAELPPPPPLPPRLTDPVPPIVVSSALWLVGLVITLLIGAPTMAVWTCAAGGALGVIGFGIFAWQRSAARRGSRTAQSGLQ